MAMTNAVVQVGGGRGFVVAGVDVHGMAEQRFIISAAHCLPRLPAPHLARDEAERTLANLIGPLGSTSRKQRPIWASLLFVDPMSDIVVLEAPDGQELFEENDQYEKFTDAIDPLPIGDMPLPAMPRVVRGSNDILELLPWPSTSAFALSLKRGWQPCTAQFTGQFLILDGPDAIESGMSGSPIINDAGAAIGLISTGGTEFNLNPSVVRCLPRWLAARLRVIA